MTIRVLQTGLHPERVDFDTPEFKRFEGLTEDKLRQANDGNVAMLRQAGFEVVNVLIRNGDTPEDVVGRAVEQGPFDALLIGAGVRLVADNTLLFEGLVNLLHAAYPNARFVFNQAAVTSPDDINRWFEGPEAKAPLR
ncbi:hypothetical protein ACFSC3_20615 [Sphingomonas floccifaciens]|jgi:hypothetical protein|uniref:Uncharacterized protein n=1 Tax=Sphingomonas floccifaciens TaxID=1844115 RepID=A0ABW4NIW2_9SPHN|nr:MULTISPECIES: hypothetical protein [Sphingomonas]MBN2970438.1 hypothetical protein [Roseomonas aeriglobus]MCH4895009.1 hypothetical protein [Sphingomonas sp. SFZ2018-12]